MAIKEIYNSYDDALEGLTNNMSIMIGGFGVQGGQPTNLMIALRDKNIKNLTLIGNVAGISMITGYGWKDSDKDKIIDQSIFFKNKQVKKIICSFPIPAQRDPVSEIEKLDLNANIVILSACNTASKDGSPDGEGLSGLTSAFFHAGTKSMLVTHWDVETNSAVRLTTGSLKNLKNSESLSIALQKTKISMMNDIETSHPFYWAPFVLIGNLNHKPI